MATLRRIGLTGGIGSGKSTVARMLEGLGAWLVDTDALSKALTGPQGAAMPAIRTEFGDAMVTAQGALDRERMRERAFSDPQARRRLEAILHPLIAQHADRRAGEAAAGQIIVFDVPLLVESGRWRARVQRVLVIDCHIDTQVQRVSQRPGWTAEAARGVIAQQASREARRAAADAVIYNDGIDLPTLEHRVHALWHAWH